MYSSEESEPEYDAEELALKALNLSRSNSQDDSDRVQIILPFSNLYQAYAFVHNYV